MSQRLLLHDRLVLPPAAQAEGVTGVHQREAMRTSAPMMWSSTIGLVSGGSTTVHISRYSSAPETAATRIPIPSSSAVPIAGQAEHEQPVRPARAGDVLVEALERAARRVGQEPPGRRPAVEPGPRRRRRVARTRTACPGTPTGTSNPTTIRSTPKTSRAHRRSRPDCSTGSRPAHRPTCPHTSSSWCPPSSIPCPHQTPHQPDPTAVPKVPSCSATPGSDRRGRALLSGASRSWPSAGFSRSALSWPPRPGRSVPAWSVSAPDDGTRRWRTEEGRLARRGRAAEQRAVRAAAERAAARGRRPADRDRGQPGPAARPARRGRRYRERTGAAGDAAPDRGGGGRPGRRRVRGARRDRRRTGRWTSSSTPGSTNPSGTGSVTSRRATASSACSSTTRGRCGCTGLAEHPRVVRLPAEPPADEHASSASRSGSATRSSATSTSPRSAAATSPPTTRRSSWRWPPPPASRSRTPGCSSRPAAGSAGWRRPTRSGPRCCPAPTPTRRCG